MMRQRGWGEVGDREARVTFQQWLFSHSFVCCVASASSCLSFSSEFVHDSSS